jgi:hypothetical protein
MTNLEPIAHVSFAGGSMSGVDDKPNDPHPNGQHANDRQSARVDLARASRFPACFLRPAFKENDIGPGP